MPCTSQLANERCTAPHTASRCPICPEAPDSPHADDRDRARLNQTVRSPIKTRDWRATLIWILLATGISAFLGTFIASRTDAFLDFKAVYFGTRCLLQGHNPYNVSELSAVYKAAGGEWPDESPVAIEVVTRNINLPSTLLFATPFALFPYGLAHVAWIVLASASLVAAAFLMWRLGAEYASEEALLLIVFLLVNCELVFKGGNTALLVVGLCVMAAWCLIEDRFALAGAICLGVCLAVKPHNCGWIWLFFLLSGGIYRRRALQALSVTAAIGLAATFWTLHVAPHWIADWRANLATTSAPGGLNEPGPFSLSGGSADMIINLQSAVSVLWNKPGIYNGVSYLICGTLLLVWALRTLKVRKSRENAWLGLAAVVAPTLLITYHRGYDMKLLLLAIPACAMLWSKRGVVGWFAFLSTAAAFVFTADFPMAVLVLLRDHLPIVMSSFLGRAWSAILLEPAPVFLLVMGTFYLWVYVKGDEALPLATEDRELRQRQRASASAYAPTVAELSTSE